jgi:2-hydroxy-6-oxonona-2,4-dienedioate hydrolase
MKGDPTEVAPMNKWAYVDGLQIHYRTSKKVVPEGRPAVVLVHGLMVSSRYMVPTLKRLARHYRTYAPDLPGFGKSEKPSLTLDMAGLSDALAAWMDALGLEGAALVGNSIGCQIIAELAVRRPELVERAVLQGATMDAHGRSVCRQVARFLLDVPREPPSLWDLALRDYLVAGTRRGWSTLCYAMENRIEENLPQLRAPTLVVRGSRDPICPQRWAEEMVQILPEGRLAVLPGAAHAANFGAPAELVGVIREFLGEGKEV